MLRTCRTRYEPPVSSHRIPSIRLVSLLLGGAFRSIAQCEEITLSQLQDYRSLWSSCNSSQCSNTRLHHYLQYLPSSSTFKIYLSVRLHGTKPVHLLQFYDHLRHHPKEKAFRLTHIEFDSHQEQILFKHLLQRHAPFVYVTVILYLVCLLLFVKNLFFIFVIIIHIFQTIVFTSLIYVYVLHLPITILNCTSIAMYLFIILIDSFFWYTCWFVNNHRRDDCTINRIIENLLTQTFYYLVPKNLTAMIILIITYTNQIIALQSFSVFSCLLLAISFFISFTLYPGKFDEIRPDSARAARVSMKRTINPGDDDVLDAASRSHF